MRKIYSVKTKRLVSSLFRELKSHREIESLTSVPRDVLRLWKAQARKNEAWKLKGSLSFAMRKKKKFLGLTH